MGKSVDLNHLKNVFCNHFMTKDSLLAKYSNFVKAMAICCDDYNEIKEIKTVLDIGANLGVYSYNFAFWFSNSKIYSFEPVPENYNLLIGNVERCEFRDRIKCFNFGFYDEEKKVKFGIPQERTDVQNTGLFKIDGKQNVQDGYVKILSNWTKENNISPDFIKIDAEGSDFKIINSSQDVLKNTKWITIEGSDECRSLLLDLQFEEIHKMKQIKGINFNKRGDSLWRNTKK